ncbi:DUF2459 domain-containing protein [Anabaena sp. UHCC 0451]|uniref:DUF2459 domain-containing protein n=1 Tax=Anabaena sp. UHCC 0451 TaxID=2055235 RepID=UPI002B206CB2|nr:DUF2459 domain-containing protein [Anabaena sp. UHCC 0451]MEA5576086.1 DUF2459 domain-containing protein [Anabaena sp. UHCC 0451]
MRLRRIALFTLAFVTSIGLIWIFTPPLIIPPKKPAGAVFVYVLNLGLHSELVLPHSQGGLILYAYGDWNYFALNQQKLSDGLAALLIPTQGTIGKRKFRNIDHLQQIAVEKNANLLSLRVAESQAIELAKSLEERFMRNISTRIENTQTGLTLVQDDQDYTILSNSNHELVAWLEELGCQVKGFVMLSNFRVKQNIPNYHNYNS